MGRRLVVNIAAAHAETTSTSHKLAEQSSLEG